MTLLEFAREYAMNWAIVLFIAGMVWRLAGVVLLVRHTDLSRPRDTHTFWGGLRTVFTRFWPHRVFLRPTLFHLATGYVLHIGLLIVVFFFVPHILYFKNLLGLEWPGLPNNVVTVAAVLTLGALVAFLVRRLTHPVLRRISGWDDYFSWLVTALPVATGLLAFGHLGLRYETMLAVHILSVALLLAWFPFGKLAHAILFIPSRAQLGAWFQRRGVRA